MNLSDMLNAATAGDPVEVSVSWSQLPRDENGKWQAAELDMFGRPVVHIVEE